MMVNDPATPFSYSEQIGFYTEGSDRAQYPVYNCPWCAGALPKRVEGGLLAPKDEYARIFDSASAVLKQEQCYEVFGKPDYDKPFPDDKGMPTDLRNIEYYNVSAWYTLEFYFQDPDYHRFVIRAKSIPFCNNAEV